MKCVKDLAVWLAEEYGVAAPGVGYEICPPDIEGDITVNCFRFAKTLKANPMEVALKVADFLGRHADVDSVSSEKAFVNVRLRADALYRDTVADARELLASIALPVTEHRKKLIEYPAPNTNKPLHLGHVRNIALGASLISILRRVGHTVIPVNLINDRGIHICKSMIAYERWGQGADPQAASRKSDHFVGDFYVRYNRELQSQIETLRNTDSSLQDESEDALFGRTEIGQAAQDMLKKWEVADSAVRDLWQKMTDWALAGFEQTFSRLGITFQKLYRESHTYKQGKKVVEQGLADGIFSRREDGAVEVDLEPEKLGKKILLRGDGTSVYITQDLGTTLLKQQEFEPDQQIWVVGDEQIHHFKVLFTVLGKLGYQWARHLHHLAYGMVDLPSGKMKSREGTVVDADDLLEEMEKMARQACLERVPEGEDPPADLTDRARVIGHGALMFWLLKFKARSRIQFDPAASLSFEGDTGPYIQYACARISSILDKAGEEPKKGPAAWGEMNAKEERELALRCAEYPWKIRKAAQELDPSIVSEYLLTLAKEFSRFYRSCPVLKAQSSELRNARLQLCAQVRAILINGLGALSIDSLESM